MEKINQLILLNLEIEGLLRVLKERPQNKETLTLLLAKNAEFQTQLAALKETDNKTPNDFPAPAESVPAPAESVPAPAESFPAQAESVPAPAESIPTPALKESLPAESAELPKTTVADNISPISEFKVENMIAQQEASDLSRAFSINDKYRFIRDLFGNNKEKFDITMQRIAGMQSLSQAYEYFLDELAWDADDPAASDFLAIVANHFNSAQ